ncbi:MAG: hypothetical protein MHM6MM_005558 [Cercozoa sp. M6MM]
MEEHERSLRRPAKRRFVSDELQQGWKVAEVSTSSQPQRIPRKLSQRGDAMGQSEAAAKMYQLTEDQERAKEKMAEGESVLSRRMRFVPMHMWNAESARDMVYSVFRDPNCARYYEDGREWGIERASLRTERWRQRAAKGEPSAWLLFSREEEHSHDKGSIPKSFIGIITLERCVGGAAPGILPGFTAVALTGACRNASEREEEMAEEDTDDWRVSVAIRPHYRGLFLAIEAISCLVRYHIEIGAITPTKLCRFLITLSPHNNPCQRIVHRFGARYCGSTKVFGRQRMVYVMRMPVADLLERVCCVQMELDATAMPSNSPAVICNGGEGDRMALNESLPDSREVSLTVAVAVQKTVHQVQLTARGYLPPRPAPAAPGATESFEQASERRLREIERLAPTVALCLVHGHTGQITAMHLLDAPNAMTTVRRKMYWSSSRQAYALRASFKVPQLPQERLPQCVLQVRLFDNDACEGSPITSAESETFDVVSDKELPCDTELVTSKHSELRIKWLDARPRTLFTQLGMPVRIKGTLAGTSHKHVRTELSVTAMHGEFNDGPQQVSISSHARGKASFSVQHDTVLEDDSSFQFQFKLFVRKVGTLKGCVCRMRIVLSYLEDGKWKQFDTLQTDAVIQVSSKPPKKKDKASPVPMPERTPLEVNTRVVNSAAGLMLHPLTDALNLSVDKQQLDGTLAALLQAATTPSPLSPLSPAASVASSSVEPSLDSLQSIDVDAALQMLLQPVQFPQSMHQPQSRHGHDPAA